MNCPDYNSPTELKTILDENSMAMQKKFGQNFLVNENARKKIVDSLSISDGIQVWEIGPGLGAMTSELLSRGAVVTAFEIDRGFARLLRRFFCDEIADGKLKIVEGDAMKTIKKELLLNEIPDRFFGNLPYNIASQIIGGTIEDGVRFEKLVVTVQKEVAERMASRAGEKEYSSFSVLCQWAYNVRTVADLAGGSFWPVPNVASRTVLLEPTNDFPNCKNSEFFRKMVRTLFSSRRKTVRNNLLSISSAQIVDDSLLSCGISPSSRVETLDVKTLLSLSDSLFSKKTGE